ncbi:MAG: hypothetical protein MI807_00840 [Verrucomicrobiales bacterium]|nr:hypothetical protein [Verrucomicrobiales bacterium]
MQMGKQFQSTYKNSQRTIIPTKQGKKVIENKTRD